MTNIRIANMNNKKKFQVLMFVIKHKNLKPLILTIKLIVRSNLFQLMLTIF
jgi:hypothetical protein